MGNLKKADCAIFAAGSAVSPSRVRTFLRADTFLIAADAGYKLCRAYGLQPDLVIGDFDSGEALSADAHMQVIPLNPIKDDTDTACAYQQAAARGFKNIVLFGGTGGRLDHTFANFDLCAYAKKQGIALSIVDDHHLIFALQNETHVLEGDQSKYVSVFAIGGACTVSLRGFAYPLTDYIFEPFCGLGVSNETTSSKAEIEVKAGTALIFVTDKDH